MNDEIKEYKAHLKGSSRNIISTTIIASQTLPEPLRSQEIERVVNKWISGQKNNYANRIAKNPSWRLSKEEWDIMIDELNIEVLSEYKLKELKNKIRSRVPSRNNKSWFSKLFSAK